ncbi:alpha/beta fold hydrolase [Halomonas organivorans]|uniref:Pimeloyl-ACP methyl ester carboxylesterase n=1 Tax=Halomonas organivorans TaxID=257772 RepID=A0A7W5G3Z9_9GAMM|nr:alpha/beta fold hydrolase [Halomonas organivorans]MBB3139893.1 pimeloyl-ACP methyl ester carboxylesterase [Halomonas organivorans]
MPQVEHRGVTIAFEEHGREGGGEQSQRLPIVLGHSFLCSGEMWREQLPALACDYRVVNVDFRGHGRSSQLDEPFTLYDAVADVIAVLDELGIQQAVWCGLSIGGMVALRAALEHPERVAGLILFDTDAGPETLAHKLKYRAMGACARRFGLRPLLPSVARLMFAATTRRENPALVDEWKQRFADIHVPSALLGLDALIKRDSLLERLAEIEVPSLVIVGEEDRSLPVPFSQRIHERLPGSSLEIIPGAGHLSALEQPARVNEVIREFLAAQATSADDGRDA